MAQKANLTPVDKYESDRPEAERLDLEKYARQTTPSIRDDGRAKVLRGETTIEEVLRVTRED